MLPITYHVFCLDIQANVNGNIFMWFSLWDFPPRTMFFICFCDAKNNNGNLLSKKTDPRPILTFAWCTVESASLGIEMIYFNLKTVLSSLLRICDKPYVFRLILEGPRIFRSCFASAIFHLDSRRVTRKERQFSWFYMGFYNFFSYSFK